jgi:hypothetical protein
LELLPTPQCDSYRFKVRIRHEQSNIPGAVGLYLADQTFSGDERQIQFLLYLTFNDVRSVRDIPVVVKDADKPTKSQNFVTLYSRMNSNAKTSSPANGTTTLCMGAPFVCARVNKPDWHDLSIAVSAAGIVVQWDDQTFELSEPRILEMIRGQLGGFASDNSGSLLVNVGWPELVRRGAMGLYLLRGSASFCSASITPLQYLQ